MSLIIGAEVTMSDNRTVASDEPILGDNRTAVESAEPEVSGVRTSVKDEPTSSDEHGPSDEAGSSYVQRSPDVEQLTISDIRVAADKLDDNIDEAFGQAAQSIWRLASTVTGSVSSAVGDAPSLGQLRENVASHLVPLDSLGHNLSSRLEALAPADKVATLAGSVKSVAQSVQRNAQQMELAILSKANERVPADEAGNLDVLLDDVGVSVTPKKMSDMKAKENRGSDAAPRALSEHSMRVEEEIAKVGASLGKTVGGLWNGLWGSEEGEWEHVGVEGSDGQRMSRAKVPTTRFEVKVYELQSNPDTYCEPADDLDGFEAWGRNFDLDASADECIEILSTHGSIAELYERVVPTIVEEDTFWMRYFYAKHLLEVDEERRKKLLERAESGGEQAGDDDGWGDDDWGDVDAQTGGTESVVVIGGGNGTEKCDSDGNVVGSEPMVTREDRDRKDVEDSGIHNKKAEDASVEKQSEIGEKVVPDVIAKDSKHHGNEKEKCVATCSSATETKNVVIDDDWGDDWE